MSNDSHVPRQHTGAASNTSTSTRLLSDYEAQQVFEYARENLLHINKWHYLAGPATADFQLTDSMGNEVDRAVQKGDYLRIDIPGPGNTKDGYDWVHVEGIEDQTSHNFHCWTIIRVRPSESPNTSSHKTRHFFAETATSNFIVERKGQVVTAAVLGRNEKANTETQGILDTMRNTVVAFTAMLGLNKPQWRNLVKGILRDACQHVKPMRDGH